MSVIPMTELLSAYLDGELSPEDHIRVDKMLAEDAALRERFEGLRQTSAGLRLLERPAPPAGLDLVPLRLLGRLDQHQDLIDRCGSYLPALKPRPANLLPYLALVLVFGLALYNYYSVWKLESPPDDSAVIGERTFFRDGEVWFQRGITTLFSTPRPIDLDSLEGRRLLEQKPELGNVAQLGEVVLDVEGDGVLRLLPRHSIDS